MNFVAFDVETANSDLSSICQLGVVVYRDGKVAETWETLVDPEDRFHGMNSSIHGITAKMVKDSPTFPEVYAQLYGFLAGNVVAHHTAFDKVSLTKVKAKYALEPIDCRWLDTARVVRRTWREHSSSGYGLKVMAKKLGIQFNHHAAGEDARAAGEILLRALEESKNTLEECLARMGGSFNSFGLDPGKKHAGNPDGPLAGEVMVFTGTLSMSRSEAAEMAARAGCDISPSVTKATTLVVIGGIDATLLEEHEKSTKHRKAEAMIAEGHPLRILVEDDFARLLEMN